MSNSVCVGKNQKLADYTQIIELFLSNKIDASTFEQNFLEMFKNDSTMWQGEEFETLNNLFTNLDAFCADSFLRDEDDIDELQLREQSKITLQRLLLFSQNEY